MILSGGDGNEIGCADGRVGLLERIIAPHGNGVARSQYRRVRATRREAHGETSRRRARFDIRSAPDVGKGICADE